MVLNHNPDGFRQIASRPFDLMLCGHTHGGQINPGFRPADVVMKYVDLLCRTFGAGQGQRAGYCGHPEIELALVKLYRVTPQTWYRTRFLAIDM